MSLIPTWPLVVGGLLLGAAGGAALDHTIMAGRIDRMERAAADVERQRAEVYAADQVAARTTEQKRAERVGQIEQGKQDEINRIAARYAADLDGLRLRANRKPAPGGGTSPAAPTCQGTTGAELSRPDAEFLVGEATRADTQRAALAACYGAYDALK